MVTIRGSIMRMKKFRSVALLGGVSIAALATTSALAIQTVEPRLTPTGASINGTTQTVPAGTTFTFYGMYSDDSASAESGLGLKVKYDGTKLTNVTVSEEYTKCRIAAADVQNPTTATAQVVMGWIDTALRPTGVVGTATGVVGWPDLADLTSGGCLNPGSINGAANAGDNAGTVTPVAATPLKLFKITGTLASGCNSAACSSTVTFDSEGNYSYANASPGFTNKSFTIQGAAAPTIALSSGGSRKTHGNGGGDKTANVASINAASVTAAASGGAINGSVESRAGSTTVAVMTFNQAVTAVSGASILVCTRWTGTAAAACTTNPTIGTVTIDPNNSSSVLIPLSGIVDQSRVQIQLTTVNGVTINAQMTIGFLAGDVNNDGFVDANDVSNVQTRVAQGQNINSSATAFRADITADGILDGNDAANVSTRVAQGRRLP